MTTTPLRSESSYYEPMVQPEYEGQQGTSQTSDWLSGQFRRIPFLLYFCWLILSFASTLGIVSIMLSDSLLSYLDPFYMLRSYQIIDISQIIGLLFFLYGCGEILYSIKTKNSRIAQQSVVKFQYNLTSSAMSCGLCVIERFEDLNILWLPMFYFLFTPIVHLIGGHFVLKAFKQNHPLVRRAASQVPDDTTEDFFEQNEAVTSEISRYNQQLNTWPYFVYKCWLKFAVLFEVSIILGYFLYYFARDLIREKRLPLEIALFGVLVVLSCLKGYSCFEMEVTTRTRALRKSERVIFLLKISTGLSLIAYLFVGIDIWLQKGFYIKSSVVSPYLLWFACVVLVPLVSLFGALKVKKILEQRESFVRVSSFTEKCYL